MKPRIIFACVALIAAMGAGIFLLGPWSGRPGGEVRQADQPLQEPHQEAGTQKPIASTNTNPGSVRAPQKKRSDSHAVPEVSQMSAAATNKVEKLNQIREQFRSLAAGSTAVALKAARTITNDNEREAALLTLVTEWTNGELSPARLRASNIQRFGLEAGLGMELAKNPELAVNWANELTEGAERYYLLQTAALSMVGTDPSSGFGLSEGMTDAERQKFAFELFAGWGAQDTEAALQWANALDDPTERDGAIKAIRTSAPVGIGAVLGMKDGYPIINGLASGGPAEISGQIRAGDRIVALAQGDSPFADAHDISLAAVVDMLRGEQGTTVRLQVIGSDAAANSAPRTVTIVRDQLKFKR
jgi:hypothetical protein